MTMDDPYMAEFYRKNWRREDNWRLPSIFAWDHKPCGILGEVFDLDKVERDIQKHAEEMNI